MFSLLTDSRCGDVRVGCAPAAPHSHGARDWPRHTHSFRLPASLWCLKTWRDAKLFPASYTRIRALDLLYLIGTSHLLQLVLKVVAVKVRKFATRRLTIVLTAWNGEWIFCFSKHVSLLLRKKSRTWQIFCREPIYSNKIKLMLYLGLYYPLNDTRILIFYSKPTKKVRVTI